MEIRELFYKEGRVFFYAIDEKKDTFIFGSSYVKEPKMAMEETNCYSWYESKEITFQKLIYEIEARMKPDKSLIVLHTFENVKEEDRADFFHKLVEIATE